MRKRLLLLLGPSGVGKTTLIDEIVRIDQAFSPVTAFTTRPPRPGDRYRTCVSDHEFKELEQTETLLALNNIYGYRYGTAKRTLLDIVQRGFAPVMDCPLAKLHTVEQAFPSQMFRVYVQPPSYEVLWNRLQDGRDPGNERFQAACKELSAVQGGTYDEHIDLRIVNTEGTAAHTAGSIIEAYLRKPQDQWPDATKLKMKNDRYRNSRGGTAVFIEILCSRCGDKMVLYQKDGHGGLHRLYLNRIFAPERYANLQYDRTVRTPQDLPNLTCNVCSVAVGTPMLHWEGRLAFRLIPGTYSKRVVGA